MIKLKLTSFLLTFFLSSTMLFASTTTEMDTGSGTATETESGTGSTSSTSFNISNAEKTKLSAPLENLFASTQWDLFLKEFELQMDVGVCCNDNVLDCAIGLKAHMIEPIGYVEHTQTPLYFPFADITLNKDGTLAILKGDSKMNTSEDDSSPRSQLGEAHFLYVPIMGMIFKKKLNFVCFHSGDLAFPYLSEFDPTWKKDYYHMKMIPHMIAMFSPQGLLTSVLDCIATESANAILGYQSGSSLDMTQLEGSGEVGDSADYDLIGDSNHATSFEKGSLSAANKVRDTLYFVNGCNGFTSVGGYTNGQDPITDLNLEWYTIQGLLHAGSAVSPVPFLYKSTNASFDLGAGGNTGTQMKKINSLSVTDTMCKWADFPLQIDSQYLPQLAYPTVGKAHENGSTGITTSTAKNVPGAANSAVFVIWSRRDYYAFAYFCDGTKKGHK